jgi:hypothetical protein
MMPSSERMKYAFTSYSEGTADGWEVGMYGCT